MHTKKSRRKERIPDTGRVRIDVRGIKYGLFRNFGWKNNLLLVVIGVLLGFGIGQLSQVVSSVRGISEFDLSAAIMPILTFAMGIWWVIGYVLFIIIITVQTLMGNTPREIVELLPVLISIYVPVLIYSIMPVVLWYIIPLKGEAQTDYPRLDTSKHVIKFYLVMVASVTVYILSDLVSMVSFVNSNVLLDHVYWFMQFLDTSLLVGLPLLIIVSLVRNRTLTINERMVIAFLTVGVVAAAMGAFFMYRNTLELEPSLFENYEILFKSNMMDGEIGDTAMEAYNRYNDYWNQFYVRTAIMLNGLLIIEMLFMVSIERKVTKPVLHLADVLEKYAKPGSGAEEEEDGLAAGGAVTGGNASGLAAAGGDAGADGAGAAAVTGKLNPEAVRESCRPYRYGYGEISSLTRTCVDMVGRIDTYTKNLSQVTAEKERIGAELNVASKIQKDMLPGVFPPFPDRTEFDLYASMTPAKEVGGDFYDFYFIDNDHLALTIADVSGKGIPASLFMVISKTLLKNQAQTGSSPKETLTYVNHQLCQNNETMMFCTVWLGILDLTSGKLTASNAGHEYPAIKKKDGSYELVKGRHDPALGIIDGIRYNEYELILEKGDSLFVYTDGVPEATDAAEELLGEDRMLEALNVDLQASPERSIGKVHEAIHAFVKNEPQFDDITMLCLKYLGPEETEEIEGTIKGELKVPANVDQLDEVTRFITEKLEEAGCPADTLFSISLAVEEIFVNIARYAYEGGEGDAAITFRYDQHDSTAEITFTDSGMPFDPTARPVPDITLGSEERQIGGLGIFIVKKTMDDCTYKYAGGKNILTIRKAISQSKGTVPN